ncbi:MAG: hypothetical protein H7X99_03810 [Saprospiraceae bacterium]|nr:hypothetical protein [Saprospiraceae bacterium]
MINLLLPLHSHDYPYLISTPEKVFLVKQHAGLELNEIEQDKLDTILQESFSFEKSRIDKMVFNQKDLLLTLYMKDNIEHDIMLHFRSKKAIVRFIQNIPDAQAEVNKSTSRMPVLLGLWLLVTVYAFIWAGTRETPEDVNPHGISLRIAYMGAWLMQKLVMAIGQSLTLGIGIVLVIGYGWLFYVQYLKGPETVVYRVPSNTDSM